MQSHLRAQTNPQITSTHSQTFPKTLINAGNPNFIKKGPGLPKKKPIPENNVKNLQKISVSDMLEEKPSPIFSPPIDALLAVELSLGLYNPWR